THWNAANSMFLIGGYMPTARVNSLITGKMRNSTFVQTDTLKVHEAVIVRAHVVDGKGVSLKGATVTLTVNMPSGIAQCTISAVSDSNGYAQGTCPLANGAPRGVWNAHLNTLAASGFRADLTVSVKDHNFVEQ
ncbi:MAG: hypothetical protein LC737_04045, partial [Chloroflexi bacterium]|nr:hypothetical protein [Chloroflexota bacterium]